MSIGKKDGIMQNFEQAISGGCGQRGTRNMQFLLFSCKNKPFCPAIAQKRALFRTGKKKPYCRNPPHMVQ
jgi:hypothetical protein